MTKTENDTKSLNFKSEQWVNFWVPQLKKLTGNSMTSTPFDLTKYGYLELAIKISGNFTNKTKRKNKNHFSKLLAFRHYLRRMYDELMMLSLL